MKTWFLTVPLYFDMNAGEKRVTVLRGNVTDLRLRSVFDIK